jgi:hypothetical protein
MRMSKAIAEARSASAAVAATAAGCRCQADELDVTEAIVSTKGVNALKFMTSSL